MMARAVLWDVRGGGVQGVLDEDGFGAAGGGEAGSGEGTVDAMAFFFFSFQVFVGKMIVG